MTEIRGALAATSGLVISDPLYANTVKCRYERGDLSELPLSMHAIIQTEFIDYSAGLEPGLMKEKLSACPETRLIAVVTRLYEPDISPPLHIQISPENGISIKYWRLLKASKTYRIGVDTAQIYLGNTTHASGMEPLITGSDGFYGTVVDYTVKERTVLARSKGKTLWVPSGFAGLIIDLGFDAEFISEEDLAEYIKTSFEIK